MHTFTISHWETTLVQQHLQMLSKKPNEIEED